MTRKEHLDWCKQRALELVGQGDLTGAVTSMASDLTKHADTRSSMVPGLVMLGSMDAVRGDVEGVRRWVEGFN